MKSKFFILLIFSFFSTLNISAQSDIAKFEFTVEYQKNEFKLKSHNGFNWNTLSFKATNLDKVYITKDGISIKLDDSEDSDIQFSIQKTKKGLKLTGIKGTIWKNLEFSCKWINCHQNIDQNGMVEN